MFFFSKLSISNPIVPIKKLYQLEVVLDYYLSFCLTLAVVFSEWCIAPTVSVTWNFLQCNLSETLYTVHVFLTTSSTMSFKKKENRSLIQTPGISSNKRNNWLYFNDKVTYRELSFTVIHTPMKDFQLCTLSFKKGPPHFKNFFFLSMQHLGSQLC